MVTSHPDADLHPVATGKASKIVAEHTKEQPLILYSGWFCPFVQRAWIVLEEKKTPYEYKEINPYHKEKEFLALNPRGLVPTLGCPTPSGTKPLIESNIICEYVDSFDGSPTLFPSDPYEKARMKVWIDYVGTRILPAFHRLLQHTDKSQYKLEDAKTELQNHLKTWILEADPTGPFFSGERFSMADVALAPWAVRLWVFSHFKGVSLGPEDGSSDEDAKIWKRWGKWLAAIEERPSVLNTLSDQEHYLPIYQRYAEDRAQSELAKAIRQGKSVP